MQNPQSRNKADTQLSMFLKGIFLDGRADAKAIDEPSGEVFARLYMDRSIVFSRLIVPSTLPLLYRNRIPHERLVRWRQTR